MAEDIYKYIWRCARCTYHFANIQISAGSIKQEKKCPKCKALNVLTLTDKEIVIECKLNTANGYYNGLDDSYTFGNNIPE